jgi:hypothetical protein
MQVWRTSWFTSVVLLVTIATLALQAAGPSGACFHDKPNQVTFMRYLNSRVVVLRDKTYLQAFACLHASPPRK